MLKLFSSKNKGFLKPVYKSEAELNKLLSDKWKIIFPQYAFIKNEFTLDGSVRSRGGAGRIDILAFNPKTNKFVVFELKRDLDKNIRNQASDYKDFIEDNFANIYLQSTQIYSVELPKFASISKDSIELVLMSKTFSANDIEKARKSKNEITLIKYFWFENELLVIDYINNDPDDLIEKENSEKIKNSKSGKNEIREGGVDVFQKKNLSLVKQGEKFKQLNNSGMSVKEIAEKYGYTPQAIRDCLKLADASLDIKKVIENGQLAGYAALKLIQNGRNSKEQFEIFNQAIKRSRDGKRVTVQDIKRALKKK